MIHYTPNRWLAGFAIATLTILAVSLRVDAASTYLGDNQHTSYAPVTLSKTLSQQWVVETSGKPAHAWKEPYYEQQFIDYDYVDHTCIAYGKVFFGSSADGVVRAVSASSGKLVWTFYTEAAVRFAPVAHEERIYFVSDDGFLYCVDEANGALLWKKRCAPLDTKCVGNDRVISRWPMRSGVIIENDKLYTSSGMWSRDGVFIYCIDPTNGEEIWRNDTSGFHYSAMPHGDGFGGVSPQGPMAISGNRLYVPCGRAAPAFFDANTGEFLYHENGLGYKPHYPGGSWIMQAGDWLVFKRRHNHTESDTSDEIRYASDGYASGLIFYNEKTGEPEMAWTDKNMAAVNGDAMVLAGVGGVIKVDFDTLKQEYLRYGNPSKGGLAVGWDRNVKDSKFSDLRSVEKVFGGEMKPPLHKFPKPAYMSPLPYKEWGYDIGNTYALMLTDEQVLIGGENKIAAVDLQTGDLLWDADVDGFVRGISIEDGKVIASTTKGLIYCFGDQQGNGELVRSPSSTVSVSPKSHKAAEALIQQHGSEDGYALVLGAKNPELIFAILEASNLVLTCYTDDVVEATKLRKLLEHAGILGTRCTVFTGMSDRVPFMQYMFNAVFAGDSFGSSTLAHPKAVYRVLRPYDGKLIYWAGNAAATAETFKGVMSVNDSIESAVNGFVLTRGELVGAGKWTAPFADAGRTSNSQDALVKAPLGILWWGGPSSRRIMSRHWISPVPLFSEGTLLIQGRNDIMAVDAYNGREMWNRNMKKVGRALMPMRGGNIVADKNNVYCVKETTAYALDLKTGETVRTFDFNANEAQVAEAKKLGKKQFKGKPIRLTWEYLGLIDDTLLGTLSTEDAKDDPGHGGSLKSPPLSKTLFAYDIATGELKWSYEAERTVMPTSIVADSGRVYFLDRSPENDYLMEKRRGEIKKSKCSLKAINVANGELVYDTPNLPMECKSLMLSQGIVVALPNPSEVIIPEAARGLASFDSETGNLLWEYKDEIAREWYRRRGQQGYFFINGDTLHTPYEFDLRTGTPKFTRENPITGEDRTLAMEGLNFCGGIAASKHIVMHRSSSAGYTDLDEDRGCYWLPEIRSSCWVSMLPVGGVVVSQEGLGSCTCSYSYKTSLALVPVEREEDWTIHLKKIEAKAKPGSPNYGKKQAKDTGIGDVNFIRLNFGAPGDYYSNTKKEMWFSYPRAVSAIKGKSQFDWFDIPVKGADKSKTYHFNADFNNVEGTDENKLFLTGLEGDQTLKFNLNEADYQVRFMFAEVKGAKVGERTFNVLINGKAVLKDFDITKQAEGLNKAYISEPVKVHGSFELVLKGKGGKKPLIAGIEVIKQQ